MKILLSLTWIAIGTVVIGYSAYNTGFVAGQEDARVNTVVKSTYNDPQLSLDGTFGKCTVIGEQYSACAFDARQVHY